MCRTSNAVPYRYVRVDSSERSARVVTTQTGTGRVVLITDREHTAPLIDVPEGWVVERRSDDEALDATTIAALGTGDVVVTDSPTTGVRVAASTGAPLLLLDPADRKITLSHDRTGVCRPVSLPGVQADGDDLRPVLSCAVCRSPNGRALRVLSGDGRSSITWEVVVDTGDPLCLRDGIALYKPPPTPWSDPAQVVADAGGDLEIVIDGGRAERARKVTIVPAAFRVALVSRS